MQRHHTGSGRRQALPPDWGRNHAPVAASTRNATVTLSHAAAPGDGTDGWNQTARATTAAGDTAYATDVSARIQSLITHRANGGIVAAEETVLAAPYLVTVDIDTPAVEGDEITVTTSPGDLQLQGRVLRVEHVLHGSDRFERDLFCSLI